jgi:hypothetical protein
MRSTITLSIFIAAVASAPLPQFDLGALLGGGAGASPGAGSGGGKSLFVSATFAVVTDL